jgi:hypothetical protein
MPAALPVLPDPGQKGLPCPVGRFLAWEGLEGGPRVCLGLLVGLSKARLWWGGSWPSRRLGYSLRYRRARK